MVKGLEVFREHFRDYADRYVLIGGAACDIAMNAAGLSAASVATTAYCLWAFQRSHTAKLSW